jgi:hypothetical protein
MPLPHSVPGNLVVLRAADFRPLLELGSNVAEMARGQWWISDVGSPEWAVFSADSRWLFVGDARAHEVLVLPLR